MMQMRGPGSCHDKDVFTHKPHENLDKIKLFNKVYSLSDAAASPGDLLSSHKCYAGLKAPALA